MDVVRFVFVLIEINGCFRRRWTTVQDGDVIRKVIVHNGIIEITSKKSVKDSTKEDKKEKEQKQTKKNSREENICVEKETDNNLLNNEEIKSREVMPSENTTQKEEKEDVDQILDKVRNACPFCLKHFDDEKYLKRHIVASHQKRAYKCDKCRASCQTEQGLENHRRSHSDDYFFECNICHLKYKRPITLQQHQIRAHSDVAAQFICDSCGQSFKVKVDLHVHIKRKHTNDVHICRYCGKSVTDLHSHEWKHKKRAEMANLQFSCHLCIKKFQNKTRLDNHLLLHKQGYKCTECNIVVTSSRQLEYHRTRTHKPGMTCPICKKVFLSRDNKFYQHILTHAGIRPYNCDICGEDYTQRSSLFRHRRNHPGPLPPYKSQVPIAGLAKNVLQKLLKP
ncbi:hypothetical protein P5V15_005119 [Pogonomyrmex californicus]